MGSGKTSKSDDISIDELSANVTVDTLLKVGTRLDLLFSILLKDLRPNQNELLFSNEHTSPSAFCQTLTEYIFSSFLLANKLSKEDPQGTAHLLKPFNDTIQANLDMVRAFDKKYGKLASFDQCDKQKLFMDLNTLGDQFITQRVSFENELAHLKPNGATVRPTPAF